MKCGRRALTVVSLGFGLLVIGALGLAVCTDYWLFTTEPLIPEESSSAKHKAISSPVKEVVPDVEYGTASPELMETVVLCHSGLWRMCMTTEAGTVISSDEFMPQRPSCAVINYFEQDWDRVQGADTTWSILRAMRKSSPVIVFSFLLSITAFTLSTLGNHKHDKKTIIGAVFYIFSSLLLGVGVILYISAVNDEVSHRKEPANPDGAHFSYRYGWAFFFAGGSFICAMCAAVTNITLYLKRFPTLEDMVDIIPGLEKKGNFHRVSSEEEAPDVSVCSQNPTVIF